MTKGPYQLIQEVLIYDDGSDLEDIDELYDFAEKWEGLVKIIKLHQKLGIIGKLVHTTIYNLQSHSPED